MSSSWACGAWVSKLVGYALKDAFIFVYNFLPAKNVILAGVKSVTVYDPEPVELHDLSSQVSHAIVNSNNDNKKLFQTILVLSTP
jgi:hypothetical protein